MNKLKLLALAALLVIPLAACDEDPVSVTGTISGTVSVEGSGIDGVAVTLSNGASTTTAGGGTYSFANVESGSYTVEIAPPGDATFASATKSAVLPSSGGTVTVDFSGSYVRTSAIFGSVNGAGDPLAGVTVALSGQSTASTTTDSGGQYSFSGLRAGSYTVMISGFDASAYTFTTSQTANLGAGETAVLTFTGTANQTATISGFLYLDENDKDDMYNGDTLEDKLMVAGIGITLQGPDINTSVSVDTDASGAFMFDSLEAGSYNLTLDVADASIPATVAFGGASATVQATVTAGSAAVVNFPFDITMQTVDVYAFIGIDGTKPGINPAPGVAIELYPTDADAQALTNMIGSDTTDAMGKTSFTFLRTADTSPAGAVRDNIVFSVVRTIANNELAIQADSAMEISYSSRSANAMANDTVDILNSRAMVSFVVKSIGTSAGGDVPQPGWNTAFWLDTLGATSASFVADANGVAMFSDAIAVGSLPDTFFFRLSGTQPSAAGEAFQQVAEPSMYAAASGRHLMYIHDGTAPVGSYVDLGVSRINFTTQAMLVSVFHEADDSMNFTGGDDMVNVDNIGISLWKISNDMTDTSVVSASNVPAVGTGDVVFPGLHTDSTWMVTAGTLGGASQSTLTDTMVFAQGNAGGGSVGGFGAGVGGFRHSARLCPLSADTVIVNCKTFGYKYNNTMITGTVRAADGTDADGLRVNIKPAAGNLQSNLVDTTIVVSGGAYTLGGLWEGPYDVTVSDSMGTWEYPNGGAAGAADLNGSGDGDIVSFVPTFMATTIAGVVANDRDNDGATLDPNEALAGVVLDVYLMSDTTMATIATATSDGNGAFSFGPLAEGTYVVKAQAETPDAGQVVTRRTEADGSARDTAVVTTTAGMPDAVSSGLPRWTYDTSAISNGSAVNFTFLFANTTARGIATSGGSAIEGLQMFARRCLTSAGSASPPVAGTCTTYAPGDPMSTLTAADGSFSYNALQEGVYEIAPNPASKSLTTSSPVSRLFLMVGAGDIEEGDFIIS